MMTRKNFLIAGLSGVTAFLVGRVTRSDSVQATKSFEIVRTEAEWRRLLTPGQYAVLREEGTERPFTSPLLHEERVGLLSCAGCDLPLFSSKTKFDSHTGWPSYWAALDKAVDEHTDTSFFMSRMAISCHRYGGHIGHVFSDGPRPTGLRYCMNGVAMNFIPGAA